MEATDEAVPAREADVGRARFEDGDGGGLDLGLAAGERFLELALEDVGAAAELASLRDGKVGEAAEDLRQAALPPEVGEAPGVQGAGVRRGGEVGPGPRREVVKVGQWAHLARLSGDAAGRCDFAIMARQAGPVNALGP